MAAIDPPPAPISIMSIVAVLIGSPDPFLNRCSRPASSTGAVCARPPSMRHDFAVVPPMSNASRSRCPARAPSSPAASAPPAGPDSSSRIGKARAACTETSPPAECISRNAPENPAPRNACSTRPRYRPINGCTYALAHVVTHRAYSPISAITWWLTETGTPGQASATISAARRSCAGAA